MKTNIRPVTLEILRHGPPHNQLLSPLTQYLALCGNHGATTIQVPFEHNQFRARLRPLLYEESEQLRQLQVQETSADMGQILGRVPGLISALAGMGGRSRASCVDDNWLTQPPVHLELVLSASELALLPFEMAESPPGCPGTGKALLLQSQIPICLTRRVRHNDRASACWSRTPRILFAAANPGSEIPLQQHVDALVLALQPWVNRHRFRVDRPRKLYDEHLTILPQATWQQIKSTLAAAYDESPVRPYSHVHILAHGVSVRESGSSRYGIQLHAEDDPMRPDNVSAQRLALALRPTGNEGQQGFGCPTVVTLASCYGAAQRSVVGAGASVAHTLHETGIPLVVASQFPLTFEGSVKLVQVLYRGMLRGQDPRLLLTQLRRDLRGLDEKSHDWASLVAYAAFDEDLEQQLREFRFRQAHSSADRALKAYEDHSRSKQESSNRTNSTQQSDAAQTRERELIEWLTSSLNRLIRVEREPGGAPRIGDKDLNGTIAAVQKKLAAMILKQHPNPSSQPTSHSGKSLPPHHRRALRLLKQSRDRYARARRHDRLAIWATVQELPLSLLLRDRSPRHLLWLWRQALKGVVWAWGFDRSRSGTTNLRCRLELLLMAPLVASLFDEVKLPKSTLLKRLIGNERKKSLQTALDEFLQSCDFESIQIHSLDDQLRRYQELFPTLASAIAPLSKNANPEFWNGLIPSVESLRARLSEAVGKSNAKARNLKKKKPGLKKPKARGPRP